MDSHGHYEIREREIAVTVPPFAIQTNVSGGHVIAVLAIHDASLSVDQMVQPQTDKSAGRVIQHPFTIGAVHREMPIAGNLQKDTRRPIPDELTVFRPTITLVVELYRTAVLSEWCTRHVQPDAEHYAHGHVVIRDNVHNARSILDTGKRRFQIDMGACLVPAVEIVRTALANLGHLLPSFRFPVNHTA